MPLPWTRLHAVKDYLDMLVHIQQHPGISCTINFTPVLLRQLRDYRDGVCTDRQFALFEKRAEDLTPEERIEILRDFFRANWTKMVEPYPRYFSLLMRRGKNIVDDELAAIAQQFTANEMRDIQMWYNLVWIDPLFRSEIKDLYHQSRSFREQDKERVAGVQQGILNRMFDEYRRAWDSGQIELTTSPMYHPILPLLIDSNLARPSNPNLAIPFEFRHPEDAEAQIRIGLEYFEKIFGRRPRGMWPSEGSVCHEMLALIEKQGIAWIATDEEILARSIGVSFRRDECGTPNQAALLYKPWRANGVQILFRDHRLSDLIGFVYNTWEAHKAALDFVGRVKALANVLPRHEQSIIPVILDGENAWEYYDNDGTEFIDALYETILREGVKTTTVSAFLDQHPAEHTIERLFPGSWIGANFNIWIGHQEDHRAWQVIKRVRDLLVQREITDPEVWDRLYVLEGSDWFWWFGDDFYAESKTVFDELFRANAAWIYRRIGVEPPHELFEPLAPTTALSLVQPIDRMKPVIDGRISYFYEWYNAGYVDVKRMGGTMHRFAGLFSTIYFGFDENNLYLRCDVLNHDITQYEYHIDIVKPTALTFQLGRTEGIVHAIGAIVEVAIPRAFFGAKEETFELVVRAREKGVEIDRTPLLKFTTSPRDISLYNWTA